VFAALRAGGDPGGDAGCGEGGVCMSFTYAVPLAFVFAAFTLASLPVQADFLSRQKTFANVKTAFAAKNRIVQEVLRENGLSERSLRILIVIYKAQSQLELYARSADESRFRKIAAYDICYFSGQPGPKRKRGDRQVPEGFYEIDRFNPASRYFLSLGLNYPNAADRWKSTAHDPGGDIFIHGDCVSIGCLAMTDDKIQEIYLYALFARNSGQTHIPVYSFPFRMTKTNFSRHARQHRRNPGLIAFWENLQDGFSRFAASQTELTVTVDNNGDYRFE
jgi:murein L,D-transpeptidase YafK